MNRLSKYNLRSAIVALVLFCQVFDSALLMADPGDSAKPTAKHPLQEAKTLLDIYKPVLIADTADPVHIRHLVLLSLSEHGAAPNPVDLIYDRGALVAIQSPDGQVRHEISEVNYNIDDFNRAGMSLKANETELIAAVGPAIENVLLKTLDTVVQGTSERELRSEFLNDETLPITKKNVLKKAGELGSKLVQGAKVRWRKYEIVKGQLKVAGWWAGVVAADVAIFAYLGVSLYFIKGYGDLQLAQYFTHSAELVVEFAWAAGLWYAKRKFIGKALKKIQYTQKLIEKLKAEKEESVKPDEDVSVEIESSAADLAVNRILSQIRNNRICNMGVKAVTEVLR